MTEIVEVKECHHCGCAIAVGKPAPEQCQCRCHDIARFIHRQRRVQR